MVSISATYPIRYASLNDPSSGVGEAAFAVSQDGHTVMVTIIGGEKYARSLIEGIEISAALSEWLKTNPKYFSAYPEDIRSEILGVGSALESAARTVVESIKYLLGRHLIPDDVIGMAAEFFCTLGESRYEIPVPSIGYMTGHSSLPLEGPNVPNLQAGLDAGWLPLVGMRHLFRAMQEEEPRFRWVDTTIALELAIKEALIRKRPEIETLLLEMPSPPLQKLYGPIMKEIFGESSPYLKAIKEGVEIRNKIVHRPLGFLISKQKAAEYVHDAHRAVNHLFLRLYPDWPIAQSMSLMIFHG